MEGDLEKLSKIKKQCGGCLALVFKEGLGWWCEEGNVAVMTVGQCSEWGKVISDVTIITSHPDLMLTEQGWSLRKHIHPMPTPTKLVLRVFKLTAETMECPFHGVVQVNDRMFDKTQFVGTIGLACGHTLLVNRLRAGLKHPFHGRLDSEVLQTQRNWKFGGWQVSVKKTVFLPC